MRKVLDQEKFRSKLSITPLIMRRHNDLTYLTIQVVYHDTSAPVTNTLIRCAVRTETEFTTDRAGSAVFSLSDGFTLNEVTFEVEATGFTPQNWPLA